MRIFGIRSWWVAAAALAMLIQQPQLSANAATTILPGVQTVARGIHLVPGAAIPGSQPDGNSVIIDAPEGLIVVDTGRHAAHTQKVLDFAASVRRPVRAIINSHWHLDHTGGNALIRDQYPQAQVYASSAIDGALTGFLANYRKQLETALSREDTSPEAADGFRAEIKLIDTGPELRPTRVISESGSRDIAGRTLRIYLERSAVTAGDVWILDRKTRVLISGDLVTLPAPFLDTACPYRWAQALSHLSEQKFDWLIPGHGPPMRAADLETYRKAFVGLLACSNDTQIPVSQCEDGWLTDSGRLISEADRDYARTLVRYYVGSVLRGDPKKLAKQCEV
jgi:glyoxylase-like metal-dependent hydrolase (beta-lactamase superfamily II)